MLFLSKKIDMTDPKIILYAQIGLVTIGAIMLLIHGYCYMMMSKNKEKRDIWVPPKAKPTLPFGLGPAAEPVKAEEFEKTTYTEYETKLLKESAFGILMSLAISMGMSLKFNVHVSLLMQSVMMPMGLFDSLVIKKYILGSKTPLAYGELFTQPTEASLAAAAGTLPHPIPTPIITTYSTKIPIIHLTVASLVYACIQPCN